MGSSRLISNTGRASVTTELVSGTESLSVARRFVADVLNGWQAGVDADVAMLVTSELVTNAIHASAMSVCLHLDRRPGHVRIAVQDFAPGVPRLGTLRDPTAFGGRGLALVDALSDAWGVEPLDGGGKTVWCDLAAARTVLAYGRPGRPS